MKNLRKSVARSQANSARFRRTKHRNINLEYEQIHRIKINNLLNMKKLISLVLKVKFISYFYGKGFFCIDHSIFSTTGYAIGTDTFGACPLLSPQNPPSSSDI